MLHTWQHSIQFPYYPGTLVYGMGMLWGFGKVPFNPHIMLAHMIWQSMKWQTSMHTISTLLSTAVGTCTAVCCIWYGNEMTFHTIPVLSHTFSEQL